MAKAKSEGAVPLAVSVEVAGEKPMRLHVMADKAALSAHLRAAWQTYNVRATIDGEVLECTLNRKTAGAAMRSVFNDITKAAAE